MRTVRAFLQFIWGSLRIVLRGGPLYWLWVLALLAMIVVGGWAYWRQFNEGLITTSMRDQVSWRSCW